MTEEVKDNVKRFLDKDPETIIFIAENDTSIAMAVKGSIAGIATTIQMAMDNNNHLKMAIDLIHLKKLNDNMKKGILSGIMPNKKQNPQDN